MQRECVKLCRGDSNMSLDDIHKVSEEGLRKELTSLGFDLGESRHALSGILYPHHVGHYVGVDLHDCGTYGRVRTLHQGQVVTIEP